MDRDARAYLWDVQVAAEAISRFVEGLDAATYAKDAMITAAVERKFEIIGEALNQLSKLSPEIAQRVPHLAKSSDFEISWSTGMR